MRITISYEDERPDEVIDDLFDWVVNGVAEKLLVVDKSMHGYTFDLTEVANVTWERS